MLCVIPVKLALNDDNESVGVLAPFFWLSTVIVSGFWALFVGVPVSAALVRFGRGILSFLAAGFIGGAITATFWSINADDINRVRGAIDLFSEEWRSFALVCIPLTFSTGYALFFWMAIRWLDGPNARAEAGMSIK